SGVERAGVHGALVSFPTRRSSDLSELVEKGAAYYCFCSKERLAEMRRQQEARHELTKYDRHCRSIPPAEAALRAKSELHTVRLRSEERTSELQSPCNLVCRLLLEK